MKSKLFFSFPLIKPFSKRVLNKNKLCIQGITMPELYENLSKKIKKKDNGKSEILLLGKWKQLNTI